MPPSGCLCYNDFEAMEISQKTYHSGFISVLGRTNVGKSSLINALLGQKIAAVSPRPQTTRRRQMGVLTLEDPPAQMIFIDTPGYHQPRFRLGELMNQEALATIDESDEILLIADVSQPLQNEDNELIEILNRLRKMAPLVVGLNKIDLLNQSEIEKCTLLFRETVPDAVVIPISAASGSGLPDLINRLLEYLPAGEPYFPADQLTDLYEKEIAADLIREAALSLLHEEVPHGIAVRIDQFTERGEHGAYIEATIFVERESHKPIVIGQGGRMLKSIGSLARQEIEMMSSRRVYLNLRVKVRLNWRNDPAILQRFGFR